MPRNIFAFRIWKIVVLAVLMVSTSCSPSNTPAGTVVKIEPSTSSVQVNETVRALIKADNISNLTAVETHLSFNPTVLEVVELINGGFIQADFTVQNTFDNTAGTIDYAVAQIDRSPASGSGTLLEVVFRAKASGDSAVNFRSMEAAPLGALFSDANGVAIQVSLTNGNVTVK
jgi:hypothetical protein